MAEDKKLSEWFEEYLLQEGEEGEKRTLFNTYILPHLGEKTIGELDESAVAPCLSAIVDDERGDDAFSAAALLQQLFRYIDANTGADLPQILMTPAAIGVGSEEDYNLLLLSDALLENGGRHAAILWCALHTSVPLRKLLPMNVRDFSLSDGTLLLRFLQNTRGRKKESYVTLRLDSSEIDAWAELLDRYSIDAEDVCLSSGLTAPAERKKLAVSLDELSQSCGLVQVTLADLEKAVFKRADNDDEDVYFLSRKAEERDLTEAEESAVPETAVAVEPEKNEKTVCSAIPKAGLNDLIRTFPAPILEHARRCRQFAAFIVEHIRMEEWFLDLEIKEEYLSRAMYYHDVGKSMLQLDDYYPSSIREREKNERYKQHAENGIAVLQRATETSISEYSATSYDGVIRDAIAEHHERFDGKGFPAGKAGEQISLAGRLAALVDALDHKLFLTGEPDEPDTTKVVENIASHAGTRYDPKLVTVLAEQLQTFIGFVAEMRAYYTKKRSTDEYGMRFVFHPTVPTTPYDFPIAYMAHLWLNDPYYGMVDADTIVPAMEDHPRFLTFKWLQNERLCRMISEANENNVVIPPVILPVSAIELEKKSYFSRLFRIFVKYSIRYRQIIFAVDEEDAIGNALDLVGIPEKFHLIGAQFAISGVGGSMTLMPSLHKIIPDYVILKKDYGEIRGKAIETDFVRSVTNTAGKVGVAVWCDGVPTAEAAADLAEAGVAACLGAYAGEKLPETTFKNGK